MYLVNFFIKIITLSFLCLWSFWCSSKPIDINHGISMGYSTRFIFNSEDRRVSFPVQNNNNQKIIFHGLVLSKDKKTISEQFIVSPEVLHVGKKKTEYPQVIRLTDNLPGDRESLFYLQGHFLPEMNQKEESRVNLTFSYVVLMKMFYRPEKLRSSFDAIDDVADQIDFKLDGKKLVVINKSPYFLTLNFLKTDKETVQIKNSQSLIDPFGQVILNIKNNDVNKVTWSLINDGGYATKLLTREL